MEPTRILLSIQTSRILPYIPGRDTGIQTKTTRLQNWTQKTCNTRTVDDSNTTAGTTSNTITKISVTRSHKMQKSKPNIACFNCLSRECRVSRCPHPKEKSRIKQNLEACRKSRGITQKISSYNVNYFENLSINTADIGKIYLTENLISTNQKTEPSSSQPQDMLDSDSSQSDSEHNTSQSYYADTLFIPKPNEDNHVIMTSEPDSNDSDEEQIEENEQSSNSEEYDPRSLLEIEEMEVTDSEDDSEIDERSDMSNEDYNAESENEDMSKSETDSEDSEHGKDLINS